MPRISLCRRLALAISGLALVAACTPDRPVVDDRAPGDMRGNNIDGSWHVVAVGYGSTYRSGYVPYGYPYNGLATVTEDGAAVTIQPDTNSAVLTVVNAGAQVRVLDETSGSWTHVEANGQDGFIRTSALR